MHGGGVTSPLRSTPSSEGSSVKRSLRALRAQRAASAGRPSAAAITAAWRNRRPSSVPSASARAMSVDASCIWPLEASAHASASSVKMSRAFLQLTSREIHGLAAVLPPRGQVERERARIGGHALSHQLRLERRGLVGAVQQAKRVGERPLVFGQRVEARRARQRLDGLGSASSARAGCGRARAAPPRSRARTAATRRPSAPASARRPRCSSYIASRE